ncbi:MAG: hypothetical protein PHO95_05325 [Bacteroidales bacterium]|jgi:hypothetical protein|nr:hypothetical protein [Bacteroidales bacterium]
MKANNSNFEAIPAAALSEITTGSALAVIINTTGESNILKSLGTLFCHSSYKVYYIEPGINQLRKTLDLCEEMNLRRVVITGEELPPIDKFIPEKPYSATLISPGSEFTGSDLLSHILSDNNADSFSLVGYQLYRFNPSKLKRLRERFFEEMRLGTLRGGINNAEPLIRNSTHFFLDMKSVREADFPDNISHLPNGLYGEEMCQLARYIGMGQRFKSLFLYGYVSKSKYNTTSTQLTAEVLWHLFEAMAASISEDPGVTVPEDMFNKKIVSMGQEGQELVFISSTTTGRWWMVVPDVKNNINQFIACSYSDYLTAYSGEIPLRWLFFYQKINPS